MRTQKELVLQHLKHRGAITSWDAITDYGITRLPEIIRRLKVDGYNIEKETIVKKKGERTVTFARYSIKK